MRNVMELQGMILLLAATGFFLRRKNMISREGQRCLTDLELNVILPCNIVRAFCMEFTQGMGQDLFWAFFLSLGIQVLLFFYGDLVFRRQSPGRKACLRYGTTTSNGGLLGNPMVEEIYGSYGLLLGSVFLIPLRFAMWSVGVAIFSGSADWKSALKKAGTHPCILACFLGSLLLVTGWRFPAPISRAVSSLGSCNTAIAMVIVGMILGEVDLHDFWEPTVAVYTFHRLVLLPLIVYGLTLLLPVSPQVRGVSVILTAMPAAATTGILAAKYGVEEKFGAKMVMFSTLLSLPSLAVWSLILA